MKLSQRNMFAKTFATGLAFLSFAALADTFWKGQGTDSDFYNRDNWMNWWNANYVFGGGQVGILPENGSYVTFTNAAAIAQDLWVENGTKKGVEWSLAENAEEGAGLTITNNLTIGTGKAGQLAVKNGDYLVRGAVYVGSGNGSENNGDQSSLTMDGGSLSAGGQIQVGTSSGSIGTITLNDGILHSDSFVQIGLKGTGYLYMNGGKITSGEPIRFATDEAASRAYVTMTDGELNPGKNFVVGNKGVADFSMSGGTITTTTSGEFWVGGEQLSGTGTFVMTGGLVDLHNWASIGRQGPGRLELKGGTFQVVNNGFEIARYGNSTGTVVVAGGTFNYSGNQYIAVGYDGDYGALIVSNGTVNVNGREIQIAKGSGKEGYMEISGGTLTSQGTVAVGSGGTGTLHLNKGILQANKIAAGSGTGTVLLNGGTLKARQNDTADFIQKSDKLTVNIGVGGAVFDTAGCNITVPATFNNADGLEGNGMIWKKGLGTLTISSDLDLERTFKFTIDTDLGEAGIGPIALTGTNNTLAAGKKITVDVRPENLITETYYPLITGLTNELTMASVEFSGDSFYVYTGKLENGTLSVSVSLRPGAPAKARYVDNVWKFYDNDGNALSAETEESIHTYYVFTGAEPPADLLAKASTNKIMLEAAKSGGNAVTNTIAIPSDFAPKYLAIETEEGCAVALSGDFVFTPVKFASRGTLIFGGEITLSGIVDYPFSIVEGARVTLVTPQTIGGKISGTGTLALTGGTFGYLKTGETTIMDAFAGTLVLCAGSQLDTQYNRRGNPDKFHIMLGTARVRMEGATLTVPNDNEAYIYNEVDIVSSTENVIQGGSNALCLKGRLIGGGTVTLRCPSNRGGRMQGDASDFTGTCIIENAFGANGGDEGFHGANAGSQNATWVLPADGICSEEYKKTYYVGAQDATIYFGAFQQTGAKAYVCIGTTGTSIQIGNLAGGESVIEGQFTNNPLALKKVGADSWLTLGTNFGMVANSTLTVSAGGLAFNLPTDDTVTDLTGDTVTIDTSVKIRVAMTQAQYEALDLDEEYLVAKLPTNPGYKPETELLVDGVALDTPAAAKWGVRFKSFPAVGETPAYVGAVLRRKSSGLMIIFR